jgi:hypothetical protein
MMHGHEKSDPAVVAVKPANKVAPHCGAVRGGVSRSGVGGAKGVDQGECGLAKHALDSAPGSRVTGAGTHTAHSRALWRKSRTTAPRVFHQTREVLSRICILTEH